MKYSCKIFERTKERSMILPDLELTKLLEILSQEDLDVILDSRDADAFDDAWSQLRKAVPDDGFEFDYSEIFQKISHATNNHEIASYIADDLRLIEQADRAAISGPFLTYLKQAYSSAQIPHKWTSNT